MEQVLPRMKRWKNDIPKRIREFHGKIIGFACLMHKVSNEKHASLESPPFSWGASCKLHAKGTVLHRSILSLCDDGWAETTPILLRAMLDVLANLLVIGEKDSEYRAFKYLYFFYMKAAKDQTFPNQDRLAFRSELEKGLGQLDAATRKRIDEFIDNGKFGSYWFFPEYKSPAKVIEKFTPAVADLVFMYRLYSGASHVGHVSSNIFLHEPDKIDINKRSNPEGAKLAVLHSCRCLLDLCLLRNQFEKLGLSETYLKLLGELNSFKNAIDIRN